MVITELEAIEIMLDDCVELLKELVRQRDPLLKKLEEEAKSGSNKSV